MSKGFEIKTGTQRRENIMIGLELTYNGEIFDAALDGVVDVMIIKRYDELSLTISTRPYDIPELTNEEKLQGELEYFRKLENMLKEKRLIKD